MEANDGVSVVPGATALTLIPKGPSSRAATGRVRPARLGHAVVGHVPVGQKTGDRGDGHDRPTGPGFDHGLGHVAQTEEGAPQVGVDDPVPFRRLQIEKGTVTADPAFKTAMSSPPSSWWARRTPSTTDASSVMSPRYERQAPLPAGGSSRSKRATADPASVSRRRTASPIPDDPPVTRALVPTRTHGPSRYGLGPALGSDGRRHAPWASAVSGVGVSPFGGLDGAGGDRRSRS